MTSSAKGLKVAHFEPIPGPDDGLTMVALDKPHAPTLHTTPPVALEYGPPDGLPSLRS